MGQYKRPLVQPENSLGFVGDGRVAGLAAESVGWTTALESVPRYLW